MSNILQIREFVYGKVNDNFILPWLDMLKKQYGINADYGKMDKNLLLQEVYVYAFENGTLVKFSHRILYYKSQKSSSVSFANIGNTTQRIYSEGNKAILRQVQWAFDNPLLEDEKEETIYDEAAWWAMKKEETINIENPECSESEPEPETDISIDDGAEEVIDEEQVKEQSESEVLVGRKVIHTKFGIGIIQNEDEKYLYISFAGTVKKFLPDAFERGFLTLV